jgi:hypothetical protein
MIGRISGRVAKFAGALLAVGALAAIAAGGASASEVIYDNLPSPLPANFASYGNEAYSMAEFGGQVEFAGTARKSPTILVAMSSWACESGGVYQDTCSTPKPKKKFHWPITLNVYEVGPSNSVGAKIGSATKTFALPYRPTENDAECVAKGYEAGTWYDATSGKCSHGMAFTLRFQLKHLTLPQKAIISLSYNTTTHGPTPVGSTACNSTSGGCYYDSLNVAITEPSEGTLTTGAQPTENLYVNTTYNEMDCGSSANLGTFGPTGVCPAWYEGAQLATAVTAR